MKIIDELFDGSDAHLLGDIVTADCEELRDIAEYFETRGKPMQGEFLRNVADRHQSFYDTYLIAGVDEELSSPSKFMDDISGDALASGGF